MLANFTDIPTLARKAARARRDGILSFKVRRVAINTVFVPVVSLWRARRLSPADRALDVTTGWRDHRGSTYESTCSDAALDRIATAFTAAEAARSRDCPTGLEVRGLWAEWLDIHYGPLRRLLSSGDLGTLRELLENLHREPVTTGVGGTLDDLKRVPSALSPSYFRALWCRYRDLLQEVRPAWDDVASAVVGNPHGVWVGQRLVQIETLRHAHHATVMLGLLEATDRPRILEIGGGLGGQAYQFLNLGGRGLGTYTIVDLPEVCALAAYCLMASLGEDRVRLYGEDRPVGQGPHVDVLPHWCVLVQPEGGADLVFNAHSFAEMDGVSAEFYLSQVERMAPRYFLHINHETRFRYRLPDGGHSLNRTGSELVPDPSRFTRITHERDPFVRPENHAIDAFWHAYRQDDPRTTAQDRDARTFRV